MIRMTRVPEEVTRLLAPLKSSFSSRPYLVCCWLLVAHRVCCGKATVQGLARYTPRHVAAWHLRRLLAAGRWQWARVLEWLVSDTLAAFPPPRDGVLYVVVDSTLKDKRSKQNPLVKKGRLNELPRSPSGCMSSSSLRSGMSIASPWLFPAPDAGSSGRLPSGPSCGKSAMSQWS